MLDEATLPETKDSIPVKPSLDQPTLNHPDLDQIQQAHLRQLLEEIRAVRRRHDNDEDRDDDSFDDDDDEADRESDGDAKYVELRTPDLPRMTCPICFENTYLQASPCCSYASCLSCWRAHIASALSDGRVTVNCVSLDCTKHLPRETILDIIRTDQALSDRYARLYTILNQNPRSKTCKKRLFTVGLDLFLFTSSRSSMFSFVLTRYFTAETFVQETSQTSPMFTMFIGLVLSLPSSLA